jgi:hypothetical protein
MMIHVMAHVVLLLILAFFVLFAASKADGFVKLLGMLLGYGLLLVAILVVVGCVTRPMFGGKPFGMDMHGGWMHHGWMHADQPPVPATAPAPPTVPAPPPAPPVAPAKPTGH